ncbi:protoheme IX farnesyltransferase, mitochondrial isoform X3 [Hydra vulgaris]|uniref:Protoheme IX farnesyltransferase, mitochondrial n=1 Tax=Hydra vulgaris TaxID=6087 RepID=A0ABM4CDS9_HYDVU
MLSSFLNHVLLLHTKRPFFLLDYLKNTRGIIVFGRYGHKSAQLKPLAVIADFQKKDDKEPKNLKPEEWTEVKSATFKEKLDIYSKLSKARLTGLVVLTAAAGYAIAPAPMVPLALMCTVIGTTLCSASANSLNQFLEVPYDCQMSRTRDRVLVRGLIRPMDAVLFGLGTGTIGVMTLSLVNPTTAVLGALNILLYAGIYTPSKRYHIANTWIGSLVGGIPPLMGWAACTGGLDMGALTLAAILYSWQFPHFNALSWSYRPDYSRAGYKMMSVTDPALCRRVTLRHAVAQMPIAAVVSLLGVCHWWFFFLALPFNAYLTLLSWRFYKSSNNNTARSLFRFTLLHLPFIMLLLLISKKRSKENPLLSGETIEDTLKN